MPANVVVVCAGSHVQMLYCAPWCGSVPATLASLPIVYTKSKQWPAEYRGHDSHSAAQLYCFLVLIVGRKETGFQGDMDFDNLLPAK